MCLFFLAYPQTSVTIHRIDQDFTFNIATGVVLFTILVFVIGIAQGIGKASVYRSLADHYSGNMGPVGGLVGVIGGCTGSTIRRVVIRSDWWRQGDVLELRCHVSGRNLGAAYLAFRGGC